MIKHLIRKFEAKYYPYWLVNYPAFFSQQLIGGIAGGLVFIALNSIAFLVLKSIADSNETFKNTVVDLASVLYIHIGFFLVLYFFTFLLTGQKMSSFLKYKIEFSSSPKFTIDTNQERLLFAIILSVRFLYLIGLWIFCEFFLLYTRNEDLDLFYKIFIFHITVWLSFIDFLSKEEYNRIKSRFTNLLIAIFMVMMVAGFFAEYFNFDQVFNNLHFEWHSGFLLSFLLNILNGIAYILGILFYIIQKGYYPIAIAVAIYYAPILKKRLRSRLHQPTNLASTRAKIHFKNTTIDPSAGQKQGKQT